MITEADIVLMTEACRTLPEPIGTPQDVDYLTDLMVTVLDFQQRTVTVDRAVAHFNTNVRPLVHDLDDLVELMRRWPADQAGNGALARHLWGYNFWTRAQMLRELASFFSSIAVTDQKSLRRWAAGATFEEDFKGRVPGLGRAVFQSLLMRQGVDTVKPDVHVHRFVAQVLGRSLSDADVVEVIVAAGDRLGRPAHRLDWAIWEAGHQAGAIRNARARTPGSGC